MASAPIRRKLAEWETSIRQRYVENRGDPRATRSIAPVHVGFLNEIDTADTRHLLTRYGFHSLLTLLANPHDVRRSTRGRRLHSEFYHAVVDRAHLQELESVIRASKLCSIDTESDDKDPREATLLGISFSVKDGEAYFVPLIETDLKDLTRKDVLNVLRRIFSADINFVGHNIKYDYLILRRSGVTLKHVYFDTMLATFECHGDWPFFNLPYVCKRYLGREIESYSDVVRDGSTFPRSAVGRDGKSRLPRRRHDPTVVFGSDGAASGEGHHRQFFNHTMAQCQRLGILEFDGIAVNVRRIEQNQRAALANKSLV